MVGGGGDHPEGRTYDVFLSYAHGDDKEFGYAAELATKLEEAGFSVWWDKRLIGGVDWHEAITVKMISSRLIVALWSKLALSRPMCRFEATFASGASKLLPVALEDIGPEDFTEELAGLTYRLNRVDFDVMALVDLIRHRVDATRKREYSSARAILANAKSHLPEVLSTGQPDLFGRDIEETILLNAWASCAPDADPATKTNLVILHAIGGSGKTALLRRLVDELTARNFPFAEKVIGWSAYSQGSGENSHASADAFIAEAISIMGFGEALPPDAVARARLLAELMRQKRTLLLLDGIEPLQSLPLVDNGRLRDKGLARLLIELARGNLGLVVVTSRQQLPEVENLRPPQVRSHALENLAPSAGAALLKRLGCWGRGKELEAASVDANGHALTLTALGGFIDAVEGGDIRRRDHFDLGAIAYTAEEMAAPDDTVRAAKKAAYIGRLCPAFLRTRDPRQGRGRYRDHVAEHRGPVRPSGGRLCGGGTARSGAHP
jgi:hypothetical protein